MTRTSTAKIEIRRWKVHVCAGCGCQYAYQFVRRLAFGGSTPERAAEKAQAAAERALAREIDRQPCPACGRYQPDMVAARRQALHGWFLLAAVLSSGSVAALHLCGVLQAPRALAVAMGLTAIFSAVAFVIDFLDPNRDLAENRRIAQREVAAQRLRTLQPSTLPALVGPPVRRGAYGLLPLGLALAALLSLAVPELVRWRAGWPLNEAWYPPVAGPGDETCFYLPDADAISSVKGYWSGESIVLAQVDGDPHSLLFHVESTTRQADWGQTLRAGPTDRSIRQRPWIRLRLPDDDGLAGRILALKIALRVRYPIFQEGKIVEVCENRFNLGGEKLRLAGPRAATTYRICWWSGFATATILLLLSQLVRFARASALRGTALPAEILPQEEGEKA